MILIHYDQQDYRKSRKYGLGLIWLHKEYCTICDEDLSNFIQNPS